MIATVAEAVQALGWSGDVVGPVSFGGARFWAVVQVPMPKDLGDDRPEVLLSGCLVAGRPRAAMRDAGLLAAYAPRAVLVEAAQNLTGLLIDAAVLDQGVVTIGSGGLRVLATAGPRVFQGPVSARERRLLDEVLKVWNVAHPLMVG